MTNEQILKKAIEKATKNGMKTNWPEQIEWALIFPQIVIYSHDFAKAFWKGRGEINWIDGKKKKKRITYAWQAHLQQMVLEKEPLKYIEKFL